MKIENIHLQITRNLGDYESAKLGASAKIEEGDDLMESYKAINDKLQTAFESIFKENVFVEEAKGERKPLLLNTLEYDRVKASIVANRATIDDVEKYYYIDIDVMAELLKLTRVEK